ncbi:NAD(P)/FAD-dependent oxidoreductase [Microbacterium sp. P02]|uniref:NAD(P)/FAD-dependent oxidoreductase n=1 Tax=Microbacterium sp. P02 TaxID=3366260 RepID=UPI00366AE529
MTVSRGVVVVGASIGGLTAAETLREEGYAGPIVLIGDENHLPYTRPPLSKQILLGEWEPHQAVIREVGEIDALGVEFRSSCTATGLDVGLRVLHTTTGDVAFDELVIATGTGPRRHPALPDALTLRTMGDAVRLRDRLAAAGRVAVVGAGILASEVASAARHHGADTLLVGRGASLSFGGVGTLLSAPLEDLHREHGVELALNTHVRGSRPLPRGSELEFSDGSVQRVDAVFAMIGGSPRTEWLEESSLDISDGVVCDEAGCAAPGVSAIGDVAAWRDPGSGRHVRVEHQSNAIEQAVAVACRIAHGQQSAQPIPLFWSEIHKTRINAFGWFDRDARVVDLTPPDAVGTVWGFGGRVEGEVRGVVGWNASPKAFRQARAVLARSALATTG